MKSSTGRSMFRPLTFQHDSGLTVAIRSARCRLSAVIGSGERYTQYRTRASWSIPSRIGLSRPHLIVLAATGSSISFQVMKVCPAR